MARVVQINEELIGVIDGEGNSTTIVVYRRELQLPVNSSLFQALIPSFAKPKLEVASEEVVQNEDTH